MNQNTGKALQAEASLFGALQAYEALNQQLLKASKASFDSGDTRSERRLSFSDIVRCVLQPGCAEASQLRVMINSDIDYFRKYRFVLKQTTQMQSPQQAAASTQEQLLKRTEAEFDLHVDLMSDENAYVRLNLHQNADVTSHKRAFLHCENKSAIELVTLNKDEQGQFIAVLAKDDHGLRALTDLNSHLYLSF